VILPKPYSVDVLADAVMRAAGPAGSA
jgi:hypothetical protein